MVHNLQKPVIGYYTLDLTPINKGKPRSRSRFQ